MKNIARIVRFEIVLTGLAVLLCIAPLSHAQQEKSFLDMVNKFVLIPQGEPESEMLAKAAVAVNHIKRMELPQASKSINEALQLDARNSYLHFFNGFIYHLQARQGDTQKNEMAIEGYQQALRIDPSNWIAREFLGLAYVDLKQFEQAKGAFSEVLLMSPESKVSIYGMMVASYMTGDPVTACAMADQFKKYSQQPHSGFLRSSVSVYASCGDFDNADQMRLELGKLNREPSHVARVDQRLAQWKSFYRTRDQANHRPQGAQAAPGLMQADLRNTATDAPPERLHAGFRISGQSAPPAASQEVQPAVNPAPTSATPAIPTSPTNPTSTTTDTANDGTPRMVLVDVVMVSTEELITTSKGINLLNALTFQLNFSKGFTNRVDSNGDDPVTNIIRTLTVPALTYSLNIANAGSGTNEVLARPTLAAIEGLPSEFFSGTNLNAGVMTSSVSGPSTVPVDKRFGVKLAVTPNFLPNGMVKLKVDALRTFLNASTDSDGFAYRLDVSETSANANVVMKLGDTLVLSGLSEKETSKSRSGVPFLQDVPGVQYLFSHKRNLDFQRSVLILITPRQPVYTSKVEQGQSGPMTDSMKALREKLGFSGRTPSNVESILNHLKTTDLFREFRQGDVSLERWDRMHSTGDRLKQALEFLYY